MSSVAFGTNTSSLLPHSMDQVHAINSNISRAEQHTLPLVGELWSPEKDCECIDLFKGSPGKLTKMYLYDTTEEDFCLPRFETSDVLPLPS